LNKTEVALYRVHTVQRWNHNSAVEYSKLPRKTMPPIRVRECGGGYFVIVDGHHRFAAAVLRGDSHIDVIIEPN